MVSLSLVCYYENAGHCGTSLSECMCKIRYAMTAGKKSSITKEASELGVSKRTIGQAY